MSHKSKSAPAFQFYASDIMADRRYRLMSLEERGLFISLLCECWVNRTIPANHGTMAQYLGKREDLVKVAWTDHVSSFFIESNGELTSPELEKYRATLDERKKKQSEGGTKGAKKKWNKELNNDSHPNEYPNDYPNEVSMASRVERNRKEMSREESKREESIDKGNDSEIDEWIKDYEAHDGNN